MNMSERSFKAEIPCPKLDYPKTPGFHVAASVLLGSLRNVIAGKYGTTFYWREHVCYLLNILLGAPFSASKGFRHHYVFPAAVWRKFTPPTGCAGLYCTVVGAVMEGFPELRF